MGRLKQVYKITYPNGMISVGMDLTGAITYFGSPSGKKRIAADLAEHRLDLTVRKEILWESETATGGEVRQMERQYVRSLTGASAVRIATSAALYIYATKAGKFDVWNRMLDDLGLEGHETVLDMGCGRGAVLVATAKRLPRGRAIGVDLWQADQTDNSPSATLTDAELENVAPRSRGGFGSRTPMP